MCSFSLHLIFFFRTAVLRKLFHIRFSYKHCNFSQVCLHVLVKMASKTVIRSIEFDWKQGLFVARSRGAKKRSGGGRQSPELDIRRTAPKYLSNETKIYIFITRIPRGVYIILGGFFKNFIFPTSGRYFTDIILPLLDLLAKFKRVLPCSCSPNFCSCSHARFLVSIARNFFNSVWCLIPVNMAIKFSGNARDKW